MKTLKYTLIALLATLPFASCEKTTDSGALGAGTGIAGSMARFAIVDDYLYTVDNNNLKVFDITATNDPQFLNTTELGNGIETIFPFQGHLLIGAQNGMHIYDIAQPTQPDFVSTYTHVQSCDPVVARDQYAYVTLRGGTECGGVVNSLDVLDITDLYSPQLVNQYWVNGPYGLAITEHALYVCDGDFGLRVYDATDAPNLDFVTELTDSMSTTYDCIVHDTLLMVIGDGGLHQYNISDPLAPDLIYTLGY